MPSEQKNESVKLASLEPNEVQGPKYRIEMQVCWMDHTWDNEIFVYVAQSFPESENFAESLSIKALEDYYNAENTQVSSIHVYHWCPDELYDDEGEVIEPS